MGFGPFSFFLRLWRLRRRVQEVLNHLLELWVLGWVVFVTLDHQCSTLPRTSRLIREIAAASSRRYTGTVVSRFAARRRRSCETELSFRSEDRRVGKDFVISFRSWLYPFYLKKHHIFY